MRPTGQQAAIRGADDPCDESAVIDRAKQGDSAAFAQLVRTYQDRVYGLCLRMSGNATDAEDCAQEAFVRAYGALERFDGRAKFYTWLFRIAVNVTISERRRAGRRPAILEGDLRRREPSGDGDGNFLDGIASEATDPSDRAETTEQANLVMAALNDLDDDQRGIVTLRDIESLGYDEIAEVMDIPIGTVKSRLHRARLALRKRLKPLIDGKD